MITNQAQQPIPANLTIDGVQASSDWHERNSDLAAAGWRELVREAGEAPFGYTDAVPQDQDGTPIWYTALAGYAGRADAIAAQEDQLKADPLSCARTGRERPVHTRGHGPRWKRRHLERLGVISHQMTWAMLASIPLDTALCRAAGATVTRSSRPQVES